LAARPHLAALTKAIAKAGGDEVIFDQIAAGLPMRAVAEPFGYSRQMIYAWIHAGGDERRAKWREAKELASHVLVDEAGEILDGEVPITSAHASHLKARAEHRRWLAGVWNRKDFGTEDGKIDVNLNIGSLHLDALRQAGSRPPVLQGREIKQIAPE
jgi:hypothetical protein